MSIADRRLQNALRALARGGAQIWTPEITTRQGLETEALLRALATSRNIGGNYYSDDQWLVFYRADELPDESDPVWSEVTSGSPEMVASEGILTITDDADAEYAYYTNEQSSLDNAVGTVVEARVRISSAAGLAVNRGAALAIFDGTYQFVLWLRRDGFNIDGQAHVDVDMTTWRRLRFVARGTGCALWVDEELRQTGVRMNPTIKKQIALGSWVDA